MSIFMDPSGHRRIEGQDDELLDRLALISVVAGRAPLLVTADGGLKLRAAARGVPTKMPTRS